MDDQRAFHGHDLDLHQTSAAWLGLGALDAMRVLLIEDDPLTRWMVRCALKDECRLLTAACANQAFSVCQSYRPDVVFLDMHLPDKNGDVVLQWIMRNDPGVRVIIFSGTVNETSLAHALESGAHGFIPKPFVKQDFMHYIHGEGVVT
ncbi:MAG: response regulator [Pseudomonadota bacterium]